jgi:hypothetical protein
VDCELRVPNEVSDPCHLLTSSTQLKYSALQSLNFSFHNLFSAIPYFLYSRSLNSLLCCLCVGERPMKCINPISVRRLTEPVAGSDSLWAFDYFLS